MYISCSSRLLFHTFMMYATRLKCYTPQMLHASNGSIIHTHTQTDVMCVPYRMTVFINSKIYVAFHRTWCDPHSSRSLFPLLLPSRSLLHFPIHSYREMR
jgi:hypothetical protein